MGQWTLSDNLNFHTHWTVMSTKLLWVIDNLKVKRNSFLIYPENKTLNINSIPNEKRNHHLSPGRSVLCDRLLSHSAGSAVSGTSLLLDQASRWPDSVDSSDFKVVQLLPSEICSQKLLAQSFPTGLWNISPWAAREAPEQHKKWPVDDRTGKVLKIRCPWCSWQDWWLFVSRERTNKEQMISRTVTVLQTFIYNGTSLLHTLVLTTNRQRRQQIPASSRAWIEENRLCLIWQNFERKL